MDNINISLESELQIILNSQIQLCGGDTVLQVIEVENRFAKYQLIGFDSPQIFICDFRKNSLKSIKKVFTLTRNTGSVTFDGFLEEFTKPALLCIKQQENKNIMVELRDAQIEYPKYLLFLYNGVKIPTPQKYNFVARKTIKLEKKQMASFFILDIP